MADLYSKALRCRPEFVDGEVQFRVWASKAKSVTLYFQSVHTANAAAISVEMERKAHGYFECKIAGARIGDRYGYSIDGGPVRPDPCSLWQPAGVHQPSALYDTGTFRCTENKWQSVQREDLVFYELHVGTFSKAGTFDGVIERLDDLVELGITALEILPVAQFPGKRNWGYDGVHLFATQNSYGGPEAFERLIDAAHAKGMSVFLDLVLNHLGPEGNYVSEFAHYYSHRYSTPWGPAINYDAAHSDAVRQFALECIWHWIADFKLDGLRLDAVHAMFDISSNHILSDIKVVADQAAKSNNREAIIIVESLMNDVRMIRSPEVGGYGLDGEWNEDFHAALMTMLIGERSGKYVDFNGAADLKVVLEKTFALNGRYSQYRGRRWGGNADGIPGDRFVVGVQNHDHVGNRALGERSGSLLTPAMQRLSASLMLLSPYTPLIFMGEEYGETNPFLFFCSFQDQALVESVRSGRRHDYALTGEVPDPQSARTFNLSRLSWDWTDAQRAKTRQIYKQLLQLRRTCKALRDRVHRQVELWPSITETNILILNRGKDSDQMEIIYNLTNQTLNIADLYKTFDSCIFRTEYDDLKARTIQPYECIVSDKIYVNN